MPRLRFRVTVKTMMIAVALAALVMEGWIVWGRYSTFREKATRLRVHAKGLHRVADTRARTPQSLVRGLLVEFYPGQPAIRPTGGSLHAWADYIERLARKAERDASRPWLPIPPDPPYPD